MESISILYILLIGIGATAVMDLWALLLKKFFSIPSLNYCLVGRWIEHMPDGRIAHPSILSASPKRWECYVGWIAHYAIGIFFAAALVSFVSPSWLANPTLMPAAIFGVLTVAVPFLVMQPSFGFGVAASKTPNPSQARLRSLMAHASFGFGLYISAILVNMALPAHA